MARAGVWLARGRGSTSRYPTIFLTHAGCLSSFFQVFGSMYLSIIIGKLYFCDLHKFFQTSSFGLVDYIKLKTKYFSLIYEKLFDRKDECICVSLMHEMGKCRRSVSRDRSFRTLLSHYPGNQLNFQTTIVRVNTNHRKCDVTF